MFFCSLWSKPLKPKPKKWRRAANSERRWIGPEGLPRYKHSSYLWNKDVFTLIIYHQFFLDGRSNVDSFLSDRHTETHLWVSDIILRNGRWKVIAWEHHLQVVKHAEVSKGQTGGIHNKWAQSATYRRLKRVHLRQLPLGEDTQLRQGLTTWQNIIEQTRNKNKQCNYDLERTACNNKMLAKILASFINYISAWLQHFNSKQLNLLESCSARILFLFSICTHSLMPIKLFFHGVGSRSGSALSAQRWTSCSWGAFLEGACKSPAIVLIPLLPLLLFWSLHRAKRTVNIILKYPFSLSLFHCRQ